MNYQTSLDEFALAAPDEPAVQAAPISIAVWLADRARGTNWIAATVAALFQLGLLAMLVSLGVAEFREKQRQPPLVTVNFAEQQQAAPPPTQPEADTKQVVPPKEQVVAPPAKIQLAPAQPVPVAPERAPEPAPAPAQAAPAPAAAPAASPATGTGPVKANLAANLLSSPKPVFPNSSRRKKESGVVTVRVVVGEDGRVDDISLHRSSGFPDLDQAVVAAVRNWRWSPTLRDGRPVRITGLIPINMVLRAS